jgi:16S rRNA (uracil1498-N3)-methyltransferase
LAENERINDEALKIRAYNQSQGIVKETITWRLHRLVIDPIQKQDSQILLTAEQVHYLTRVLRLKEGDRFVAIDGRGQSWLAQLVETSAQILEPLVESTELSISVTLMTALPKGNGFDEVVRCCTELGVATIIPLISDRTLLNPSSHKLERWRKISQEATEQSERQIVPMILEPMDFTQAIQQIGKDSKTNCYICVTRQDANHLLSSLQDRTFKTIAIAIGPEGGWTPEEVKVAINAGFQPVSLGHRILRAVTAPIFVLSLIAGIFES